MALLKSKAEGLAWDILFFVCLVFPIFTGGIWIQQPGLRLEFTQAGPVAILLGLWFWLAEKKKQPLKRNSLGIRLLAAFWEKWKGSLEQKPRTSLVLAWLFFGSLWFLAAWSRHAGFRSGAIDLGIFTNAFWNLAETGAPFAALKSGHSLLTDHQSFTIFPLSWIFSFYPGPGILLFLQAFGLTSGAIALYLLGTQRLGKQSKLACLLPFVYWLYFPLRAANLFDFHPEVLMLPFFLFGVWGLQEKKTSLRALGMLCFLAGMASKESGGPVAVGIGLAWILGAGPAGSKNFLRAMGAFAIAAGAALFFFDTKYIPGRFGGSYLYGNVYAPFGSSLPELATAPFRHPAEFFSRVFGASRMKFLFRILLPLAGLPLLAPVALVAALPGLAMLFLAGGEQRLALGFHYSIEPAVGLFLALVAALALPSVRRFERELLLALICLPIATYGRSEIFHARFYKITARQKWLRDEVLPRVDPSASLAATNVLVPHLATRHWSHYLPILATETGALVDCVAWDRGLNNAPMTPEEELVLNATLQEKYVLEYSCGPFSLHRRYGSERPCAVTLPACPTFE